jgi:hypothetical protein
VGTGEQFFYILLNVCILYSIKRVCIPARDYIGKLFPLFPIVAENGLKSRFIGGNNNLRSVPEIIREVQMRENKIEKRLVAAVKAINGMCPKFVSPGLDGMPDRIVLLPNGKIGFVEVKTAGKTPRALQLRRAEQLRTFGQKVFLLDRAEQITEILEEIRK